MPYVYVYVYVYAYAYCRRSIILSCVVVGVQYRAVQCSIVVPNQTSHLSCDPGLSVGRLPCHVLSYNVLSYRFYPAASPEAVGTRPDFSVLSFARKYEYVYAQYRTGTHLVQSIRRIELFVSIQYNTRGSFCLEFVIAIHPLPWNLARLHSPRFASIHSHSHSTVSVRVRALTLWAQSSDVDFDVCINLGVCVCVCVLYCIVLYCIALHCILFE